MDIRIGVLLLGLKGRRNLMNNLNYIIKQSLKKILIKVPVIKAKIQRYDYLNKTIYNCGFEPGHYYSPIPNLEEVEKSSTTIFAPKHLNDINLNTENQLKLLSDFLVYYQNPSE